MCRRRNKFMKRINVIEEVLKLRKVKCEILP